MGWKADTRTLRQIRLVGKLCESADTSHSDLAAIVAKVAEIPRLNRDLPLALEPVVALVFELALFPNNSIQIDVSIIIEVNPTASCMG